MVIIFVFVYYNLITLSYGGDPELGRNKFRDVQLFPVMRALKLQTNK